MSQHGLLQPKRPHCWAAEDLPAGTTGLRLVRLLPGDRLRSYTAMDCKDGAAGIAQTLNQCFVNGPAIDDEGGYGIIDLLSGYDIIGGNRRRQRKAVSALAAEDRLQRREH